MILPLASVESVLANMQGSMSQEYSHIKVFFGIISIASTPKLFYPIILSLTGAL